LAQYILFFVHKEAHFAPRRSASIKSLFGKG